MAEEQLQQFLEKVRQLNAFVALSEARPNLRQALSECSDHAGVVALAASHGFAIGRRWGEVDPLDAPGPEPMPGEERQEVLLEAPGLRLERIHSCAASTPAGHWYEQAESEWVMVLQGSASLRFEDEPCPRQLTAGDWLTISPGRRHRVEATDPAPGTLWLALFYWP